MEIPAEKIEQLWALAEECKQVAASYGLDQLEEVENILSIATIEELADWEHLMLLYLERFGRRDYGLTNSVTSLLIRTLFGSRKKVQDSPPPLF